MAQKNTHTHISKRLRCTHSSEIVEEKKKEKKHTRKNTPSPQKNQTKTTTNKQTKEQTTKPPTRIKTSNEPISTISIFCLPTGSLLASQDNFPLLNNKQTNKAKKPPNNKNSYRISRSRQRHRVTPRQQTKQHKIKKLPQLSTTVSLYAMCCYGV